MPTPFEVLGIDPEADEAALVAAYRRRVKRAHPDHGGSPAEFRRVQTAYERLQAADREEWATIADEASTHATTTTADGDGARTRARDHPRPGADGIDPDDVAVEYLNYEVLSDRGWDLGDEDLFEAAAAAGLDPVDYGIVGVDPDRYLLDSAERCGYEWPFACRDGACANCAVAVRAGEMTMPVNHILPEELVARGIRLSCVSKPLTERLRVLYNVKHLPVLDDLRLPPGPGD